MATPSERRHDHRADADVGHDAVGPLGVAEGRVRAVVIGGDDPALDDGPSEHPGARGELEAADPRAATRALDAGIVRESQVPGRGVDQVDHRAVGIEQTGGFLDGLGEQLVDAAHAPFGVDRDVWMRSGRGGLRREDTTRPPRAGIAVRPSRLRHPADSSVDGRRRVGGGERPGRSVSHVESARRLTGRTMPT
jgi:hypothetical protein